MKQAKSVAPKHLPFALVEAGAKGLRLVAVNAMARNFGLGAGQRLADARAAVPDLLSELHEPEQDMASLLGSPPKRWGMPVTSSNMPSGGSGETQGL